MGRTCVLVVDNAVSASIPDLLSQWEQDRTAEGWSVLPRIVSPASTEDLRSQLQSLRPDHTFLVGDTIPPLYIITSPDGHPSRPILCDLLYVADGTLAGNPATHVYTVTGTKPWGVVGRICFANQTLAKQRAGGTTPLYRDYFQRRHQWTDIDLNYRARIAVADHFNYGGLVSIGESARHYSPSYLLEATFPTGNDSYPYDGTWLSWHQNPVLIGLSLSGGIDRNWLFTMGHTQDWAAIAPKVAFAGIFGSYMIDVLGEDSLLMSCVTNPHTLIGFYPWFGVFDYSLLLQGETIGDCARSVPYLTFQPYTGILIGDPTMALTADQTAIIDIQRQVTDLATRVANLEKPNPVPTPTPSNTAIFLKRDTTTQGNWLGIYGADGYNIIGDLAKNPAYCIPNWSGQSFWMWEPSSALFESLRKASDQNLRLAACYYTFNTMSIDILLTDGMAHKVSLYLVDLYSIGRVEKVDIYDTVSNTLLNTQNVSNFGNGEYLSWNITGHVKIVITFVSCPAGKPQTAVVSGLFFDAAG